MTVEAMRRNLLQVRQTWHKRCVACGSEDHHGLGLEFRVDAAGRIEGSFPCQAAFEGYPGHLHGGIIATLLDAAMTNCLFAHGLVGLTAELKVRYPGAVRVGVPVRLSAWLERSSRRLHLLRALLEQQGAVKATACAKFLEDPHLGADQVFKGSAPPPGGRSGGPG